MRGTIRLARRHPGKPVPLSASLLSNGGAVTAAVPPGTSAAKYFVSVRVWNTSDLTVHPAVPVVPDSDRHEWRGNGTIAFTIN